MTECGACGGALAPYEVSVSGYGYGSRAAEGAREPDEDGHIGMQRNQ